PCTAFFAIFPASCRNEKLLPGSRIGGRGAQPDPRGKAEDEHVEGRRASPGGSFGAGRRLHGLAMAPYSQLANRPRLSGRNRRQLDCLWLAGIEAFAGRRGFRTTAA